MSLAGTFILPEGTPRETKLSVCVHPARHARLFGARASHRPCARPGEPVPEVRRRVSGVGSGASYSRRKASQFRVGARAFFRGRMTTDPRHRRVHESSYDDDVFEHERSRYFARPAEGFHYRESGRLAVGVAKIASISSTVAASPWPTSKSFAARLVATGVFAFAGIFTPFVATAASPSQPGIVKSSVSRHQPGRRRFARLYSRAGCLLSRARAGLQGRHRSR